MHIGLPPELALALEDDIPNNFALLSRRPGRAAATTLASRMQGHNGRRVVPGRRLKLANSAGKRLLNIPAPIEPVHWHRQAVTHKQALQGGHGTGLNLRARRLRHCRRSILRHLS